MGSHPANLAARLLLELSALATLGWWGWQVGTGWTAFLLAGGIPVVAAAIWGTFAVRGDPSRSGRAPIPVPGVLRLVIELAVFGFAVWALHDQGASSASWALGIAVLLHYAVSYDRIVWLIKQ